MTLALVSAVACRYSVRDVGFVDLKRGDYELWKLLEDRCYKKEYAYEGDSDRSSSHDHLAKNARFVVRKGDTEHQCQQAHGQRDNLFPGLDADD